MPSSRRDQAFEDLVHEVSDPLFRTAMLLLGFSPGAVRVRSHRTLARLRQTLAALNDYDTSGKRP